MLFKKVICLCISEFIYYFSVIQVKMHYTFYRQQVHAQSSAAEHSSVISLLCTRIVYTTLLQPLESVSCCQPTSSDGCSITEIKDVNILHIQPIFVWFISACVFLLDWGGGGRALCYLCGMNRLEEYDLCTQFLKLNSVMIIFQ